MAKRNVFITGATLGLVRHEQMIAALVHAVENPAQGISIIEVPQIRAFPSL